MAAEAIVSTVLEPLTSNILSEVVQDVRLVTDVSKEIEKLTTNFKAIQAVLVDAEQRQVKETAVGVWLDKLKDASYDMDDVLDEWITAILKLEIEGIPKKKARFSFPKLLFPFTQFVLRHDIGVKIKEINENLDSIALEKDKYNLNAIRSIEEPQRLKTTSFIEVSEIRGRDEEKIDLVNKLLTESKQERASLPVISIVGLGGIGKTTLAQFAYNDTEIKSKSIDGIDIGVWSSNDSWLLFKQFAFCDRSKEECEKLEIIGREIVGKCKGLPLAIKTIGSLLRFKKTRDQWQRILDSEMWKLKELEKGLFPPLLLSYNELPSMVKRCFSYCALFPKDYVIKKDELIKLWMSQGYLGCEHEAEIEIIGEDYFDTLAMHSFFQEFEKDGNGNIYMCKMHDIVHDFAQFLVKTECFSKEIYGGEKASIDVSCEKARHSMLIMKSSDYVNISSVQKLRSLLIEDKRESRSMSCFSPDLFEQMTCLRSLKLNGSWDNKIPSEIGKLIHLRYLNMSELSMKELPETLCCLYNLQTLNISECWSLEKLPQGMGKLINLRHLINWGTVNLRYMPKMEKLVCLRRLDRFIVGGGRNGMGLGCLKNMNKLRGHLRLEGLGEVVDEAEAKNAQLMNKKNLVVLNLYFNGGSDISSAEECNKDSAVLEALQPPPNLERLYIWYCRSISLSPHWMVSLIHLKKLTLQDCRNCEYLPANLGKLPLLESLKIKGMKSVKRVGNEFVGIETSSSSSSSPSLIAFPKLKTLWIHSMENWEEWEYKITAGDITIMPSLSNLYIFDCPKLKSLPDHLLHATTLERLDISWDCFSLKQVYEVEEISGENGKKNILKKKIERCNEESSSSNAIQNCP